MSYGWNDSDWVDPDEKTCKCEECDHWEECPEGCGWGYCTVHKDFTQEDEQCG